MTRLKTISSLVSGLLVFVFLGAGVARAQYTITGATPGGGEVIVGNGASLGALNSSSTPVALSAGGFNQVTLDLGSVATASSEDTITFGSSSNIFLNNGTVIGSSGGYSAVSFFSSAVAISNETATNNGALTGGAGVSSAEAGSGLEFFTIGFAINNIAVTNTGAITGGINTFSSGGGGPGVEILADNAGGNITGVTVTNKGTITGGAATGSSGFGGFGIGIEAHDSVGFVTVNNAGTVTGGNSNGTTGAAAVYIDAFNGNTSSISLVNTGALTGGSDIGGGFGGAGFFVGADTGSVSGVTLSNGGSITGGGGGDGAAGTPGNAGGNGGSGGNGIWIESPAGNLGSVILTNSGNVAGGSVNGNGGVGGGALSTGGDGGAGGAGGNGIVLTSGGSLSGITLMNNGSVTGGSSNGNGGAGGGALTTGGDGGAGGAGGNGIVLTSGGNLSGITLMNNGSVTGGSSNGNGGVGGGALTTGGAGGVGGAGGNGIVLTSGGNLSGIILTNNGSITGGSGNGTGGVGGIGGGSGGAGSAGGNGVFITAGAAGSSNLIFNNYGTVTGGSGGVAGNGITSNAGNLTINNWGVISTGAGANPAAINLQSSSGNVVNLNGHSSVNGLITASGNPNSNFLNLNFTGMNPASIAALKAQLTAQGVLTGQDSTGTFTVRGVTYTYDPLVVNLNVTSYEGQVITPNQFAIAVSLDSATVNPAPGSSLFNLFNAIDQSGNVPGALEALSPQQYQAYGDLAIANTTAIVQNVDARLNNIRDGSESIDTTGVGGTTTAQAAESGQQTTAGYSKDDGKESKNIVPPPAPEKRWGMFATGDGLFFRGNSHDVNLQDDRSNSAGTLAGVDAKIGEHVIAGALFSYNNTDATLSSGNNSNGHATIESYSGGIYGSYHQDGFYLNGLAAYTRNHYSSDRNILIPGFGANASANTNGNQASVNLDGGYDWHATDRLTLGPIGGLQYVHLDVNGFNEIGAGAANLAVNSQDMNSLQSRVGGRINYHLLTGQYSSFAADLHAAYQHEFLDDSRGIGASFIGDGLTPFSVQTTSPLRDAAVVGLGLNFTFHDRLTLFVDYELLLWRASSLEQNLNGGGRISF